MVFTDTPNLKKMNTDVTMFHQHLRKLLLKKIRAKTSVTKASDIFLFRKEKKK